MQITVFGASGRVGHIVVELLVQQGHTVVAFVHRKNPFEGESKVQVVQGDVTDSQAIAQAIQGSDAVISCLGSWGTPTKNILKTAMLSLLPAMEQGGPKRLISLTGVGALMPGEKTSALTRSNRLLLKALQPKVLKDGEEHLELLSKSPLDWTVLRSPVMTGKESSIYRIDDALPPPWVTVSRQAVATALVAQLNDRSHLRSAPAIYPR